MGRSFRPGVGMNAGSNSKNQYFAGCLLVILQSVVYGFGDPISKMAYETVPVFSLLTARYLIAFLFLCLLCRGSLVSNLKETDARIWMLPSLCIAGCYIAGNIALKYSAATSVAFLRSLSTLMTPVLLFVLYGKRIRRNQMIILAIVIGGMYLLCGHGGLSGFGIGEIWSLTAALFMAGSLIFGQRAMEKMDAMTLTAVQAGVSTLAACLCALFFDHGIRLSAAGSTVWLIILYLAVACTAAGYLLQNLSLRYISPKAVALLQCACPVLTAVFSFILLHEKLTVAGFLGAGIILLGIMAEILQGEKESTGDKR